MFGWGGAGARRDCRCWSGGVSERIALGLRAFLSLSSRGARDRDSFRCTCVSASAFQSRAQCKRKEKDLDKETQRDVELFQASSSRRGQGWREPRYGERTCRRRWWLWLWTFARGGERSKSGVGASTRRSGSPTTPAPLIAAAVAAAPTLAALPCRVVTRGEGTRIEDPSHQDSAGRGHMSLNPISSQSLPVLFIYLQERNPESGTCPASAPRSNGRES